MLKEEIVNLLLVTPKYRGQSKHFLMKNKKAVLQEMLANVDKEPVVAKVDIEEVRPQLDKEVEREILDKDLTALKKAFSNIAPKEMTRFDWDNYGDNSCLRVFIKQWKYKLRSKGFDVSSLELNTSVH